MRSVTAFWDSSISRISVCSRAISSAVLRSDCMLRCFGASGAASLSGAGVSGASMMPTARKDDAGVLKPSVQGGACGLHVPLPRRREVLEPGQELEKRLSLGFLGLHCAFLCRSAWGLSFVLRGPPRCVGVTKPQYIGVRRCVNRFHWYCDPREGRGTVGPAAPPRLRLRRRGGEPSRSASSRRPMPGR